MFLPRFVGMLVGLSVCEITWKVID